MLCDTEWWKYSQILMYTLVSGGNKNILWHWYRGKRPTKGGLVKKHRQIDLEMVACDFHPVLTLLMVWEITISSDRDPSTGCVLSPSRATIGDSRRGETEKGRVGLVWRGEGFDNVIGTETALTLSSSNRFPRWL